MLTNRRWQHVAVFLLFSCGFSVVSAGADRKPNLVVILADDKD